MARKVTRRRKLKPKPPPEQIWVAASIMGGPGIWANRQGDMKCNTKYIREDVVNELLEEAWCAEPELVGSDVEGDDANSSA